MTRFEAAFQDSPLRPTSKTQARVEQNEAADKLARPVEDDAAADGGLICSWEVAVCSTVAGSLRWVA